MCNKCKSQLLLARSADSSAVLVVPNVKIRMEAQHSVPPRSHHDFLRETFYQLLYP
jgi:hypothetical protein